MAAAMNARLLAIAQRRAMIAAEAGRQRAAQRELLAILRKDLAFAGLGLIAGRALVRRPWLRALVLGGLAAAAAGRLALRR
jgi:hypothetical protein